jgi:hypothetical protein
VTVSRFRTLVDLFSRRFFENDLLAPDIDLRPVGIWIVGALLAPSLLWSAKRIVPYGLMSVLGPEVMEARPRGSTRRCSSPWPCSTPGS